jgi:hypothetical protein
MLFWWRRLLKLDEKGGGKKHQACPNHHVKDKSMDKPDTDYPVYENKETK